MNKHTPGPWTAIKCPPENGKEDRVIYVDGRKQHGSSDGVCFILRSCECHAAVSEQIANANLIAAAPDLLAACEFVLAHAFERKWDGDERAFALIGSALKKASGGTVA